MLTATFQLDWPNYVKQLFSVQEAAGSASEHAFSVDCFLDSSSADSQARTVRLKLLGFAFLPLALFVFTLVFWLPLSFIRRKPYYKFELVTTNVVLFFLVHPNIVKVTFNFFSCRQLEIGEYWLESYLNIPCWDFIHYRYALCVALPSIIVWGIGAPLVCLLILVRNRNRLALLEMKIRLGFVYTGYEVTKYYWEFVILYRKIAIISVSVFLSTISVTIQALTVMLILIASFSLQLKQKPYAMMAMNELEAKAILVASITIYCGMYYMTRTLDSGSQVFMFTAIVVANAYFLLFWMFRTMRAVLEVLMKRFPCCVRVFGKLYRVQGLKPTSVFGSSGIGNTEMIKASELHLDLSRFHDSELINESSLPRFQGSDSRVRVPDNSRSELSPSFQ